MEKQKEKEKKPLRFWIWLIIFVLAFVSLVVSGFLLWKNYFYKDKTDKTMDDIRSEVMISTEEAGSEKEPVPVPIPFDEVKKNCPDAYAWITIPDTVVNYEIVQHPTERSYYLDHSSTQKQSKSGAIYTQFYNTKDFSDYNTVIYGHNMLNGTMFGQLKKYKSKAFFDSHREIYVYMPNRVLKYTVFAAYLWNDDHLLLNFNFEDPMVRSSYWKQILAQHNMNGIIADDVLVTADDRVITLSTCSSRDDQRYLVQAVLTYDSDEE